MIYSSTAAAEKTAVYHGPIDRSETSQSMLCTVRLKSTQPMACAQKSNITLLHMHVCLLRTPRYFFRWLALLTLFNRSERS